MSGDARDPREAVLVDIICEEGQCKGTGTPAELLARLDAADPLRAAMPKIVGALRRYRLDHEKAAAMMLEGMSMDDGPHGCGCDLCVQADRALSLSPTGDTE